MQGASFFEKKAGSIVDLSLVFTTCGHAMHARQPCAAPMRIPRHGINKLKKEHEQGMAI
jgi:hypothetical protein